MTRVLTEREITMLAIISGLLALIGWAVILTILLNTFPTQSNLINACGFITSSIVILGTGMLTTIMLSEYNERLERQQNPNEQVQGGM